MATLPFNEIPSGLEAEKTVLGALLLDPEAILKVASYLEPSDFTDPILADIYEAIVDLHQERTPIDFVTVTTKLEDHDKIQQIGGSAFLADLAASTPTSSHIDQYAQIVHQNGNKRALQKLGQSMAASALTGDLSFADSWAIASENLLALGQLDRNEKPVQLSTISKNRYDVFTEVQAGNDEEQKRRVPSGFSNIDYYFNGYEPQSLHIIAGRPGMGKTALMLNMAINAAEGNEKRVLFFSLEMSKEQMTDRILSGRLGAPLWEMQRGRISDDNMQKFGTVIDQINPLSLYIDDDHDTTLANLRAKALAHQLEHGLDALFIDYLQLIEPPRNQSNNSNLREQVSAVSRGLKKLARELRVPVITGCQLSRAVENRTPPIPQLSDLRESGTIEQDADGVLMLYREGYYNEDADNPDLTTVFIRKNRQGPVGSADLIFQKERMLFVSVDRNQ